MKRIVSVLLLIVLCASLCACGENIPEGNVVGYGDTWIDEVFFKSEVAAYKASYVYSYLGLDGDLASIWSEESEEEGVTKGEAILNLTTTECCAMAWVIEWAGKNGVALDEEDEEIVLNDINTLVESDGGRDAYLESIEKMGLTEDTILKNARMSLLYDKAMTALTSEGGLFEITEDVTNAYFDENFVAVKHIYINNVAETDEEGTYVQISPETLEKKNEKIKTMEEALEGGEDFDVLYAMSDDGMQAVYPDGMAITTGDVWSVDYENACFKLEVGEWVKLEIPSVGVYFIKRVEIPEGQRAERIQEVPYYLRPSIQEKIYEDYKDEFIINTEYIENFDVVSLPIE